jgi:hypothetical protein
MAEDDKDDKDVKVEDKPEEEEVDVTPLPSAKELKTYSEDDLTNLERKLRREMSSLDKTHSEERAELRNEIEELREWKENQERIAARREKAGEDSDTLVLPPEDIPPAQPSPPPSDPHDVDSDVPRRAGWKRAWHGSLEYWDW